MELHWRAQVMQSGTDVQNLSAILFQLRERRPADIERPFQIDIDHRAEAVRRKFLCRAQKISGGAVDYDVDFAESFDGGSERPLNDGDVFRIGAIEFVFSDPASGSPRRR